MISQLILSYYKDKQNTNRTIIILNNINAILEFYCAFRVAAMKEDSFLCSRVYTIKYMGILVG